MTWLVIFEHPDPREVDDAGERHQRRVYADARDREHAIHLGWRQNARMAADQQRPLYEFASATELDDTGQPVTRSEPRGRLWRRRSE